MYLSYLDLKIKVFNLSNFPTPFSLNFWWNIGFFMIVLTLMQMMSGILLSLTMNVGYSCLDSKNYVLKELAYGWLFVNTHDMVPNFMFFFMYLHMFKSFLYPTYSHTMLWMSGILLYMIFIVAAFTGYSLVFGSMGMWAMVVICNIVKYMFGEEMASILFFSEEEGLSDLVLYKIFTYHYIFSIFMIFLLFMHVYVLHKLGSSSFSPTYCDYISFSTILFLKDLGFGMFFSLPLLEFLFYSPDIFLVGENFMKADEFKASEMSVEWYLSLVFIILSGVESKMLGLIFVLMGFLLVMFKNYFKNLFGSNLMPTSLVILNLFMLMSLMKMGSLPFSSFLTLLPVLLVMSLNLFLDLFAFSMMFVKHHYQK